MGGWRSHFSRVSAIFISLPLVSHVRSLSVIGWYKSYEPKARWMEWFFNTKSRHFPHNLRKPTLDSINGVNGPLALDTKDTPIVTGNRIFVTVSVVGFGMSKAIVTYHGLPTSANTLDWVFAIVVSSLSVFFIPSKLGVHIFEEHTASKCTKTKPPPLGPPSSKRTISH